MHRRTDALLLIAIYEFVTGAILLLISCVVLPILLILTPFVADSFGNFLLQFVWVGLGLLATLGLGIASIVVGIGVLARREWARVGAMALAVLALVGFPLWTIAGILIIWYLAGDEARESFNGEGWSGRFTFSNFSTGSRESTTVAPSGDPSVPTRAPATPPPRETRTVELVPIDESRETTVGARDTPAPGPPETGSVIPEPPMGATETLPPRPEPPIDATETRGQQPDEPPDVSEKPRPS